ncbi:helix-turn-helix transcriptional regulator [Vreelandella alkaliphila]|uniref:AlpA family transcriptional regulator n=1 Tax=Vreelandella alkaliphila TaxID=272774 RepID=A0ABX4HL03_9GAMM|nr:AlpA family phage regulatory protein [Halomonas humidisoli]PAU73184.1 AlpA family transcriptional regulator [Halomonas humidisoli]
MAATIKPQTTPRQGCEFLNVKQLANRYGVHPATIHRWVKEGNFSKPIKLGENCTRWALSDVEAWEQSQREAC